jgi:hypothetical protein
MNSNNLLIKEYNINKNINLNKNKMNPTNVINGNIKLITGKRILN